jgi:hypothetical protein
MKTHRSSLVLALLMATAGGLAPNAAAVVAAPVASSSAIAISGKVLAKPENVFVSGTVLVKSEMIVDLDFGSPAHVALSIDLSGVKVVGLTSGATYTFAPTELVLWRPLAAADAIESTILFYRNSPTLSTSTSVSTAGRAQISLSLKYDTTTGKLTAGSSTVGAAPQ